jgi:histidinol-phosphatase
MSGQQLDLERAVATARRAVESASEAALRHFRGDFRRERKDDGSLVTDADRDSEAAILTVIRECFPSHSVLAEEGGRIEGDPDSRWIVDPLDGTLGFSRGGTHWGPIVALEHRGRIVAGAMALPALGETWWAGRGLGCRRYGDPVRLSSVTEWPEAVLSLGELGNLLDRNPEGIAELIRTAASSRCYGDVAGCAQLLRGQAEAWLETGVKPWDIAAPSILVEEAGGRVTDFDGGPALANGEVVATNGHLHDHALGVLFSRKTPS